MPRTLNGIGQQIKDSLKHDIPIGAMSRAFRNLADPKELGTVMAFMDNLEHQEQMGRHGDMKSVIKDYRADEAVATKAFSALQVDQVTAEVIQRRGGSDAERPLPPLTSRDFVEAAFQAHSGE